MKIKIDTTGKVFIDSAIRKKPKGIIKAYLRLLEWLRKDVKDGHFPKSRYYDESIRGILLRAKEKNNLRRQNKQAKEPPDKEDRINNMIKQYIVKKFIFGDFTVYSEQFLSLWNDKGFPEHILYFYVNRGNEANVKTEQQIDSDGDGNLIRIATYFFITVPYGWLSECIRNGGPKVSEKWRGVGYGVPQRSIYIGSGKWLSLAGRLIHEEEKEIPFVRIWDNEGRRINTKITIVAGEDPRIVAEPTADGSVVVIIVYAKGHKPVYTTCMGIGGKAYECLYIGRSVVLAKMIPYRWRGYYTDLFVRTDGYWRPLK